MADLTYRVILEPADEGGFIVRIPTFPHIHTEGDSQVHAIAMAKDAIELELSYLTENDMPLPPSDRKDTIETTVTVHTAA